jgi:act minimal PKS acyl carrier protein
MATLTFDDLVRTMASCAGVADGVQLGPDIIDEPFSTLDYDSLAVLELSVQLENRLGVRIDDDAVNAFRTPRDVLDHVNRLGTGA